MPGKGTSPRSHVAACAAISGPYGQHSSSASRGVCSFRDDLLREFHHQRAGWTPRGVADSYFIPSRSRESRSAIITHPTSHSAALLPTSVAGRPCQHSYVEHFVDRCLEHDVPDEIIAQHAMYMIRSMQDGIQMFEEVQRHRYMEGILEHKVEELSMQVSLQQSLQQSPPPLEKQLRVAYPAHEKQNTGGGASAQVVPFDSPARRDFSQGPSTEVSPASPVHASSSNVVQSVGTCTEETFHDGGPMAESTATNPQQTDSSTSVVKRLEPSLILATRDVSKAIHGKQQAIVRHRTSNGPDPRGFEKSSMITYNRRRRAKAAASQEGKSKEEEPRGRAINVRSSEDHLVTKNAPREAGLRGAFASQRLGRQPSQPMAAARRLVRHESQSQFIERLATPRRQRDDSAEGTAPSSPVSTPTLLRVRSPPGAPNSRRAEGVDVRCFSRPKSAFSRGEAAAAGSSSTATSEAARSDHAARSTPAPPNNDRLYRGLSSIQLSSDVPPYLTQIDESPLAVPMRRRLSCMGGTPSVSHTSDAPHDGDAAMGTCSASMTTPVKRLNHRILVDDATQSEGHASAALQTFPHRHIGDIALTPPLVESPQLARYLSDTRAALSQLQTSLRQRRHAAPTFGAPPTRRPATAAGVSVSRDERHHLAQRERSPLGWDRAAVADDGARRFPPHERAAMETYHDYDGNVSELSSDVDAL